MQHIYLPTSLKIHCLRSVFVSGIIISSVTFGDSTIREKYFCAACGCETKKKGPEIASVLLVAHTKKKSCLSSVQTDGRYHATKKKKKNLSKCF